MVELLAHVELPVRVDAQERLMRFGRRVLPVLREMTVPSAEARLRIRAILDAYAQVELTAELKASRFALGAPVSVDLALINHTDDTYMIPLEQGQLTPFRITIGGRTRQLRRGELEFVKPSSVKGFIRLGPGDGILARCAIRPQDLPRKRAGTYELVADYRSTHSLKVDVGARTGGMVQGDQSPLKLTSNVLKIDISTRTPTELELALADPDHRMRALVELRLRDDDSVLPLLRKNVDNPELRLWAIRRLGAKGDVRDLKTVRKALRDPDRQVRIAATVGLGNFSERGSLRRLCSLARTDTELRPHAIEALSKRKSALAIDTYVIVLLNYGDGPWVPTIQNSLYKWTGIRVANTPSEVRAFERWWQANQKRWTEQNRQR
ncbi:MAG: HEAT repeat domain-containing protein [Planctomycetota bacterium]